MEGEKEFPWICLIEKLPLRLRLSGFIDIFLIIVISAKQIY